MVLSRNNILVGTLLCFSACVSAQNLISLASNLSRKGTAAPGSCQEQAAVLARNLIDLPRPDSWQWIILCDDASWHRFLIQRDASNDFTSDELIYASTDLAAHQTFLRGSTLLRPDNPDAKPDHVIAHELAHIILNTADEARSEQQALRWLSEREQRPRAALSGQ